MAYRQINTRSPFYVQLATTEPVAQLELRIWTGDVATDKPTAATYTLTKEALGGEATLEISELIRDYCTQDDSNTAAVVWVETRFTDFNVITADAGIYIATEGYTVFTEGLQHNGQTFEDEYICLPEDPKPNNSGVSGAAYDKVFRVAGAAGEGSLFSYLVQPTDEVSWTKTFYFANGGSYTQPIMPSTDSGGQIRAISLSDSISKMVFNFNGTSILVIHDIFDCNKYNPNDNTSLSYATGAARAITLYYVNKQGAKNSLAFTLKHTEDISTTSDTFKRNVSNLASMNHSGGMHASRKRLTGSKQSFTINTDYLNEYFVKQVEEIILSEYVWAKIHSIESGYRLPVNVTNTKLTKKNHLNDGLIQYTFTIESASEYLNNVR
tara:strand:- start:3671 stop:4813 length:1143 start_codon:yes stop_codon:yes gene_type:complete